MTAWIQTFTGQAFHPLDPQPDTINITDIAHALSMICRFNGHSRKFYSVAEHCVIMSEMIPKRYALAALMHDAAEAYVSDVARPIKPHLPMFKEIESKIMAAICKRFGFSWTGRDDVTVKIADLRMLATERQQIMALKAPEWDSLKDVVPYDTHLECWSPGKAELCFLSRFRVLSVMV